MSSREEHSDEEHTERDERDGREPRQERGETKRSVSDRRAGDRRAHDRRRHERREVEPLPSRARAPRARNAAWPLVEAHYFNRATDRDLGPESEVRRVRVQAGDALLQAYLGLVPEPVGVALFAHGAWSSRLGPRNRALAQALRAVHVSTLLPDLLTEPELRVEMDTNHLRFNVPTLADRLVGAIDWLDAQAETRGLPVALVGASTGSAAALIAAVRRPERVVAIASRGGRIDMAADALPAVRAPTLLAVGEEDRPVLALTERWHHQLGAEHRLERVPGAGHLFDEPGALAAVAHLTLDWLLPRLRAARGTGAALVAEGALGISAARTADDR